MVDSASARPSGRPITLLIAALGGEGGGVLTDWIVGAAMSEGYPVQSTSIPGVAQRTGATTYYIEIFSEKTETLGERAPVMGLYPGPGIIDVMVASELLEAGRALELGFVTPDRTTLIASSHRVFSIAEKSAMGDGSYDADRVLKAARELSRRPLLMDFAALARDRGSVLNAVLLGAIAGSEDLPVSAEAFEAAIRERGVAVDSNLAGFEAGRAAVRGELTEPSPSPPPERSWSRNRATAAGLLAKLPDSFPAECRSILEEGVKRVVDFQNPSYGARYLERVGAILEADRWRGGEERGYVLTREAARRLAVWMTFEDVIRVAELKSRAVRFDRVRAEVGAKPDEPVRVTEFLKPGVEEIGSLLPAFLGRPIIAAAERAGIKSRLNMAMRVRSDTILGYLRIWLLARLKWWRPRSYRFAEEQKLIERWLETVVSAAKQHERLALEVVACADLVKGYGETHARGRGNLLRILDRIVDPILRDGATPGAAETIERARAAALSDPDGAALGEVLAKGPDNCTIMQTPVPAVAAAAGPVHHQGGPQS